MKKLVLAAVCTFSLIGYVLADDITAVVTKIDGKSVTYYKASKGMKGGGKKGGKGGGFTKDADATAMTATISASLKVVKGKYNKDDMKYEANGDVDGGLTADMFKTIDPEKGVSTVLTVDKGKITQIMVVGGKKKGG